MGARLNTMPTCVSSPPSTSSTNSDMLLIEMV